ncbi:iron-containing redox enzyme family protein [Jiangella rhizosphaerae]|uniref:Iron-containing redox enzyme family protein n=1 Tax=Jiangella rhizosphaerae TaxID=2293569 RepID=A0A418KRH0_9ACTN|nr:iron-containing redox enzyme family protein [Jiangella rhizosphaerae]RIQ25068.1 iron-containing redox enzyme family protein [Jiangella rhizosphaerae]
MRIPKARGELSEALAAALQEGTAPAELADVAATDDADRHLSLWTLYELSYRGFDGVDDELEWQPELLALRHTLERRFEAELREWFSPPELGEPFADALFELIENDDGASVATFVQREATLDQTLELLRYRTIYHLKEADPTAWVVPRLTTGPKAALMELQYDEYGCGDPNRLHSHLFVRGLDACGLRSDYGAYIDDVPVEVLVQNNAMSLFGLHRRLRGAALGHLAAFEATSSLPSRRMAQGLERLGLPTEMIAYYEEHVEADAVHEQLAVRTICGALVEEEPAQAAEVAFGALACLGLEDRFARRMLAEWGAE